MRENDLKALKTADLQARDDRGNSLLGYAAAFGSVDAVKLLLDRGAEVDAKNQFDATPLLLGAYDPEKARLLIAKGADVNAVSKNGRTPLMRAAGCDGCSETVKLLLAKGAKVDSQDAVKGTALDEAVQANDLDTIRLLLDRGADPKGNSFFAPLTAAAGHCNIPAMKMLLAKGADINAANTFGGKVKFGNIQLTHITALMFAAPGCGVDTIKTLLDAGAKINEQDDRHMTPLMFSVASEHQDLAVVNLLLKSGAELDSKSTMGETALDWARKFGNPQVIAALEKAGAHPGDPFSPPRRKAASPRTASQAAQTALALLQRSNAEFFKQSGCVGCHNQPIGVAAYGVARAHGLPLDEAAAKQDLATMNSENFRGRENALEGMGGGGGTDTSAYFLFSMAQAKAPADAKTDSAVVYMASAQHRDGAWRLEGVSRAPIQEGTISRTVLAVRALQVYGLPARRAEFDARVARARDWLLEAKAETNDDFAMQTLGLHWMGASAGKVNGVAKALIAAQRPDGGWAQNRNLSSDAYATGQTLWALREAGALSVTDPAYQRGVKFLLDTQFEDGSWYVRSRAVKLQPYFQGGFPYDHDQWISSTATGYAVMALAPVR
ncbi:MAG TPA: ankyrin repeat domain-containing protein [Candidatus Sulfopaludibacter sp.]|nr:ankyrin repeat domain-containing protein [Candidatus Sulfopaludibacter sp.]